MSRPVGLRAALLAPVVAVLAVAAVLAGPVADVDPVDAQSQNRAAVIVHTGGGSAAVCVRFDEPTISGLDALRRAGLGAVIRSFSGQGSAVCGINGVGCPADDSCLTCQAPNYWAYHKAAPGAGGFTFASAGAGSTSVSDGSVEGWQWGTGAAPPFQTVDQVCGAAPAPAPQPASPAPAPAPAGPSSGAGGGEGSAPGVAAPQSSSTTGPVATTTIAVTTTTVTAPGDDAASTTAGPTDEEVDGELAAVSAADDDGGGGGSPWAVMLFVVLVAGVGGAAVIIRRRRAG